MNKAPTSPPVSPKRQAILDGAVACFMEHGYAATSMDNVAAAAGVSKATIYAHFSSKEDLFSAVIIGRCEAEFIGGGQWPDDTQDARTSLTQVAHLMLTFITAPNTLAIHRVVVAEAIRQPELASAFWNSGPGRVVPRIAEMFASLDQRKLLKVPDPMIAALVFANMLKSEMFFCRLLGLPAGTERMTYDDTITTAVEIALKAYSPA